VTNLRRVERVEFLTSQLCSVTIFFLVSYSASIMAFAPGMSAGRRSTLKGYPDSYGNARSALPMPTPLAKPTNTRLSLAGPALRGNMPPPPIPPPSNPRQSLYRSQNVNPLLASTSKAAALGRTPMKCVHSVL
jgi:hypothetical protein